MTVLLVQIFKQGRKELFCSLKHLEAGVCPYFGIFSYLWPNSYFDNGFKMILTIVSFIQNFVQEEHIYINS
jgi:hypothetical protein